MSSSSSIVWYRLFRSFATSILLLENLLLLTTPLPFITYSVCTLFCTQSSPFCLGRQNSFFHGEDLFCCLSNNLMSIPANALTHQRCYYDCFIEHSPIHQTGLLIEQLSWMIFRKTLFWNTATFCSTRFIVVYILLTYKTIGQDNVLLLCIIQFSFWREKF